MVFSDNYRKSFIIALIGFFALVVLTSCAVSHRKDSKALRIQDDYQDNVPKGYVEFHGGDTRRILATHVEIYEKEGDKENLLIENKVVHSAWTGVVITPPDRLRVAMSPGLHTLVLKLGTANEQFQVNVEDKKITFVHVDYTLIGSDSKEFYNRQGQLTGRRSTFTFTLKVIPQHTRLPVTLDSKTYDSYITALNNSEWGVKAYAIEALGKYRNPKATEVFIKISLDEKEDRIVRQLAIKALSNFSDPAAINSLGSILNNKNNCSNCERLQVESAKTLGKIKDERGIEFLASYINKHKKAAYGSQKQGGPFSPFSASIEALGDIGGTAVDHLIPMLTDGDCNCNEITNPFHVRHGICYDVIGALGKIPDQKSLDALIKLENAKSSDLRKNALKSIKSVKKELK